MEIVSTTDSPEQVRAALEANGYDPVTQQPPAAEPIPATSTDDNAAPSGDGTIDPASETGQPTGQTAAGEPKKKRAWFYDRIEDLTHDKRELRAELETLRAERDKGKPAAAEATPPAAAPAEQALTKPERPKRPKQSEFSTIEELETAEEAYDTAMVKYEDDLAEFTRKSAVADFERNQHAAAEAQVVEQRKQHIAKKFDEGRAAHADFDAVALQEEVKVQPAMLDAIMESDDPQEVLYWLGSHPDEAEALLPSTGFRNSQEQLVANRAAARAVARIERELGGTAAAPAAAAVFAAPAAQPVPPRKTTSAPAPIRPLSGGSGSSASPDLRTRVIGQNGWTAADERRASGSSGRRRG